MADHQRATHIANQVRGGLKMNQPDEALAVVCEAYAELQAKVGALRDSLGYFDRVPMPSPDVG